MFAACPQCFMAMSLPRAFAAIVALNTTPVALGVESIRRNPGRSRSCSAPWCSAWRSRSSSVPGSSRIIEQSRERAQLIERLEAAQAELADLSRQAGTLAERQRLAGEIHDTIAQGLTSIVMLLQAADGEIGADPPEARRHVGLAAQTARESLAEARAMVATLTPAHLEGGPLYEALGRLTDRIGAELGITARFEVCGPARPLPPNAEVVLLRAAQEALANVRKHARAADVQVILAYQPQAVRLDIRDDGAGFDPEQVTAVTACAACGAGSSRWAAACWCAPAPAPAPRCRWRCPGERARLARPGRTGPGAAGRRPSGGARRGARHARTGTGHRGGRRGRVG